MNEKDNSDPKKSNLSLRIICLIIFLLFLIYLYFVFTDLGAPPIINILILLFFLLIMIGPLINGFKKSFYYRLFPKKKTEQEFKRKTTRSQSPIIQAQDIDYKYRRPIIRSCRYCGMTVANFMKKCPQCGKIIY